MWGLVGFALLCEVSAALGAAEWIVVRVVVSDLREGAGDENVLSAPLPELTPHPAVADVPCPDEGAFDGAASDCAPSGSVDIVAAVDLFPIVGGGRPSDEDRRDCLRLTDEVLTEFPVGTVENDRWPFCTPTSPLPDMYGLLFFEGVCFFEFGFIW